MARLTARILKLERLLPTGLKAELAAMSNEELARRIEAALRQMSEEDVRAMAQEYPHFFTPKVLEKELERGGHCTAAAWVTACQAKAIRDKDRDRPQDGPLSDPTAGGPRSRTPNAKWLA